MSPVSLALQLDSLSTESLTGELKKNSNTLVTMKWMEYHEMDEICFGGSRLVDHCCLEQLDEENELAFELSL